MLVKCNNGHYYDKEHDNECPICKADADSTGSVGEIICIFGEGEGIKYPLHEGANRIGTGYQMDICLADDMQITRDNHCSIVYDVNKHKFTIVPTAGSLTYVNDVLLKQPRLLYEKDVFRIGRGNYKLVKKKN